MIGVGLVGFITILASSARTSVNAALDGAFTGDFAIDAGTASSGGGRDPALATRIDQLAEVDAATGVAQGAAEVDGSAAQVLGADPETAFGAIDIDVRQGSVADLDADGIGVFADVAE